MNALLEFRKHGLPISWVTIQQGLRGPGRFGPEIDLQEVLEWLDSELGTGRVPPRGVEVWMAIRDDDGARELMAELAGGIDPISDADTAKWQWLLLDRVLAVLHTDPFYAILEIADFWANFDDVPSHPAPSRDDLLSGDATHRDRLVGQQRAWRDAALAELTGGQTSQ